MPLLIILSITSRWQAFSTVGCYFSLSWTPVPVVQWCWFPETLLRSPVKCMPIKRPFKSQHQCYNDHLPFSQAWECRQAVQGHTGRHVVTATNKGMALSSPLTHVTGLPEAITPTAQCEVWETPITTNKIKGNTHSPLPQHLSLALSFTPTLSLFLPLSLSLALSLMGTLWNYDTFWVAVKNIQLGSSHCVLHK